MAYGLRLLDQIEQWLDAGPIPFPHRGDRVIELGSQMINADTPLAVIIRFIKKFRPDFDESEIVTGLPTSSFRWRLRLPNVPSMRSRLSVL
jgi:hypothetical protein